MTRVLGLIATSVALAAAPLNNRELQDYFDRKTDEIASACLTEVSSRADWEEMRLKYREQLFEMLSLSPRPAKGDLHATITGKVEGEGFVVEKLHFQSMPGLYVTGNLYLPKDIPGPLPTILYVCGHGQVKTNGISYGNKVTYQHHGAWFARNGYACLTLDTIQLGEIEGVHHGTYRETMWWWNSRGYTPAGVEAWNCIRALDYLETRPEVDKTRFGVTGRSGGGAYSWWITALDERIKVSAPVAGITDLHNHVVDGVVEGHCDCMYFVNTYRWDYPLLAALTAPRPLLIANSDKDTIFPLDGVIRTHAKARRIYELYGATSNLGVLITEGPHKDTQDLQLPVFRWFNRHLKREDPVISMAATKFFTPQELKVFPELPENERTSRIHDTFVTRTPIEDPKELKRVLREKSFAAWPNKSEAEGYNHALTKLNGRELRTLEFDSEKEIPLKLTYLPVDRPSEVQLHIVAEGGVPEVITERNPRAVVAFLEVRPDGSADAKKATQIRRRYMLVGTTLEAMRVWDISQGVSVLRSLREFKDLPLHIIAEGKNAANAALYAAMADDPPKKLTLVGLPKEETAQPDYLNFTRFTSLDEIIRHLSNGGFGQPVKIVTPQAD